MVAHDHLKIARSLAELLDNKFSFLGIKFGLDPILDVLPFPIVGDVIALALSVYIIWIASTLQLPVEKLRTMVVYVILDFLVGLVPILGWIADVTFKANVKNLQLIEEHLNANPHVLEGEIVG